MIQCGMVETERDPTDPLKLANEWQIKMVNKLLAHKEQIEKFLGEPVTNQIFWSPLEYHEGSNYKMRYGPSPTNIILFNQTTNEIRNVLLLSCNPSI